MWFQDTTVPIPFIFPLKHLSCHSLYLNHPHLHFNVPLRKRQYHAICRIQPYACLLRRKSFGHSKNYFWGDVAVGICSEMQQPGTPKFHCIWWLIVIAKGVMIKYCLYQIENTVGKVCNFMTSSSTKLWICVELEVVQLAVWLSWHLRLWRRNNCYPHSAFTKQGTECELSDNMVNVN